MLLRALLAFVFLLVDAAASSSHPGAVWWGPKTLGLPSSDQLFALLTAPESAWPLLATRTGTFKLFLDMLYEAEMPGLPPGFGTTDAELTALIAALARTGTKVGIEVGGMRWGKQYCNASEGLAYAALEQKHVARWLRLNGTIDSLTTDHAIVWNIRGSSNPNPNPHKVSPDCMPAVPVMTRIDVVAQIFASWRTFLGPRASLGFIESLGFWEIEGTDGTNFTNTDPTHLNNITGWIPKLDDVTALLLAAAAKHNPMPDIPLVDHYQIDFAMEGVEGDTRAYGAAPPTGLNYNRILGAEAIMKKHGLVSGVIANAFPAKVNGRCIVGCDPTFTPSHSAVVRTLNFSRGYMAQPLRASEYALLEQWQPVPNVTGPETVPDTGMWMASRAAAILLPTPA